MLFVGSACFDAATKMEFFSNHNRWEAERKSAAAVLIGYYALCVLCCAMWQMMLGRGLISLKNWKGNDISSTNHEINIIDEKLKFQLNTLNYVTNSSWKMCLPRMIIIKIWRLNVVAWRETIWCNCTLQRELYDLYLCIEIHDGTDSSGHLR